MFNRGAIFSLIAAILIAAAPVRADSLTLITSPGAQSANDSIGWSQLGDDATALSSSFAASSAKGLGVTCGLTGSGSLTAVVCPATPCSWAGVSTGISAGDELLWTSDTGNSGNGPLTLTFGNGVSGGGAFVQADGPGLFTVQIQAFNRATSLGSFTEQSDASGDPIYVGVLDHTGANINQLVFSLTASTGNLTDFGVDQIELNNNGTTPTATATATKTATATPTTTVTATPTATKTATATSTATVTPTTTVTATPTATKTATATSTATVTPTATKTATATPTATVTPTATSTPGPTNTVLRFEPHTLTFGARGFADGTGAPSTPLRVKISNPLKATNVPVVINAPEFDGTGDFSIDPGTTTCTAGLTLKRGSFCFVGVLFQPTGLGARHAALKIQDDAHNNPQIVTLKGKGKPPGLVVSPKQIVFGKVPVGASVTHDITLTNNSRVPIALSAPTPPVNGFSIIQNTCGAALDHTAGANTCTITIAFTPSAKPTVASSLKVNDDAADSPQKVTLTGSGK